MSISRVLTHRRRAWRRMVLFRELAKSRVRWTFPDSGDWWCVPPRHPRRRAERRRELLASKSTIEHAAAVLSTCDRGELRDHAFGDCEITWRRNGVDLGFGYFGGESNGVSVLVHRTHWVKFHGADAERLRQHGRLEGIGRNDSSGPDSYREGTCMPGLTLGGVLSEITTPTCKEGGQHRWEERGGYDDEDVGWIEPYFFCLDCRARTVECDGCGEPIGPPRGGSKCAACVAEEYDHDEACSPLPQEER